MIFTNRTITVRKGESRIDEPIVVYRGDYELEVRFTILNSKFNFKSGTNMIETEKASYGQLAILTPYGGNIFSDIVKCNDGSVTFVLTADMLNQIEEVGLYSFQIRLMDYNKESRVSIPPIEFGIEVREPIASEDHDNSVNNAIVGYSIAKVVDPKEENVGDTFDESGNYNRTKWETGDRISEGKLNKIEDAIDKVNQNEKDNTATLSRRIDNNFNILDTTKADKNGIFSMANMGQDVKEAMTGGSVAVVGKDTVLSENIVNRQVTREKTNFYDFSLDGNLVNDLSVTKGRGYHGDGSLNETGKKAMITIYKSQLNFVDGGIKIAYNRSCDFAFWGAQDEFISGYFNQHVNDTQTANIDNIPVTADHVTITFGISALDSIVICKKENYKAGLKGIYTDKQLELHANQLTGKIDLTQLGDVKIYPNGNLITRLNMIKGYYNTKGKYVGDGQSVVIELEEGQIYKFNFNTVFSFWDVDGMFIKGGNWGSLSGTTNTADFNSTNIPSNAKVLKMLIFDEDLDRAVLCKADYFKVGLKPQYIIDGLVASDKGETTSIINPLQGKKAVFLGDSWCAGNSESRGTWASRIKRNNPSMTVTNYGMHGADWAQCSIHVLDHEDKLTVMKEADYIIIEAYTNGLYGDVSGLTKPLGKIDEFNYMSLEQIEKLPNTYAKDLEKALYRIATECHGKKIGVIFPYKAVAHLSPTNGFVAFRPQVMACCRKYNIPVFDNFDGCNIPSWHEELRKDYYVENDTVHLNAKGYDVITPSIENWMKSL